MATPASRELAEQGAQQFDMGQPLAAMIAQLISRALAGDTEFFANTPGAKRRAGLARKSGDQEKERLRKNLAGKGLEGTFAGQAALSGVERETDMSVLGQLFSEMEKYQNLAPGFSMGLLQGGTNATAQAGRIEAATSQSGLLQQMMPILLSSLGMAAGTALGGGLGTGLSSGMSGLFSKLFATAAPTAVGAVSGMGASPNNNIDID